VRSVQKLKELGREAYAAFMGAHELPSIKKDMP
jgi:hypothetical protein